MRWWIAILAVVCVGVVAGMIWRAQDRGAGIPASAAPVTTSPDVVVGVEAFMRAVDNHRGPVRVEGLVASVAPDGRFFTLIDRNEFADCGTLNCAELVLPVQWAGPGPAIKDLVQVAGEVKEVAASTMNKQTRLVFMANAVRKVE